MERGGNTSLCKHSAGLPIELRRCELNFFVMLWECEVKNEIAVVLEVTYGNP